MSVRTITGRAEFGTSVPLSATFDEPPEFDVGDRVVAVHPVGPVVRRILQGSAGLRHGPHNRSG
jgi:hypothetical protein